MIHSLPSDIGADNFHERYKNALINELMLVGSAKIFSHDLLYQSSFLAIAECFHQIGTIEAFEWYHLIHSGLPSSRPIDELARCSVPEGHNIIVLNNNDVSLAAAYYQTKNIYVWGNQVSFTDLYPFSEKGLELAQSIPADADVVSVIAADAGRLQDKGIDIIILIHNELQKLGLKTCFVVVDSFNNGREGYEESRSAWWESYHKDNGQMIFMSTEIGSREVSRSDVFGLLSMADVFIYPSVGESSSLLIQEAALAKNLLVLNSSVPQMAEQIPHEMALFYAFGSTRFAQQNTDYPKIAQDIATKLLGNDVLRVKQRISKHSTQLPI